MPEPLSFKRGKLATEERFHGVIRSAPYTKIHQRDEIRRDVITSIISTILFEERWTSALLIVGLYPPRNWLEGSASVRWNPLSQGQLRNQNLPISSPLLDLRSMMEKLISSSMFANTSNFWLLRIIMKPLCAVYSLPVWAICHKNGSKNYCTRRS